MKERGNYSSDVSGQDLFRTKSI